MSSLSGIAPQHRRADLTEMQDSEIQSQDNHRAPDDLIERLSYGTDVFGQSWKGRRVAIVGLGKSGLAAAALLCQVGARVCATDARNSADLNAAKSLLETLGVESVELGSHTQSSLNRCELVVISPGVTESSLPVRWALKRRLPILSEVELAFHFCRSPIIAITGTNGKSTAVTLIAQLLQSIGRSSVTCGNLGVPFSSVLGELMPDAVAVVEVSSFQLLWCKKFRPHIGVLLNVGTNHLDRHGDRQAYLAAKAKLFRSQKPQDWAVLNGRDSTIVEMAKELTTQCVWFGENRSNPPEFWLAPETRQALSDNAQSALQVGRILGIPDPLTSQVLRGFRGLEHRLECLGLVRGIEFVNDSKSTTPHSLLYALSQIRGRVVVIIGGRDKGLDFHELAQSLRDPRVGGIVLIGESRTKMARFLHGHPGLIECDTLEDAVKSAFALAGIGGTVLFSPACASFDMFHNFEDRGRAFKHIIQSLKNGARRSAAKDKGAYGLLGKVHPPSSVSHSNKA